MKKIQNALLVLFAVLSFSQAQANTATITRVSEAVKVIQASEIAAAIGGIKSAAEIPALASSAKEIAEFKQAIINSANAVQAYENNTLPEGVDKATAKQALAGIISGQLLMAKSLEDANLVQGVDRATLKKAMKALIFGKATLFLSGQSTEGWTAESIKGLARFIETFNSSDTKQISSADAFLQAVKAQADKNGISTDQFLKQLISKCA